MPLFVCIGYFLCATCGKTELLEQFHKRSGRKHICRQDSQQKSNDDTYSMCDSEQHDDPVHDQSLDFPDLNVHEPIEVEENQKPPVP